MTVLDYIVIAGLVVLFEYFVVWYANRSVERAYRRLQRDQDDEK